MQNRSTILLLLFTVTLAVGALTLWQSSNDNEAVERFRSLFSTSAVYDLQNSLPSLPTRLVSCTAVLHCLRSLSLYSHLGPRGVTPHGVQRTVKVRELGSDLRPMRKAGGLRSPKNLS